MNWRKLICRILRHKLVLDGRVTMTSGEMPVVHPWRLRCVYCGRVDPWQNAREVGIP